MDYLRADYKRWINADSWTVERAILLLINAEILPKDNGIYDCDLPRTMTEQSVFNKFMEIWPILESSLKYGGLKKLDKGCVGLWNDVNPIDFIRWAKLKGYLIPCELKVISTATQSETVIYADIGNHAGTETKLLNQFDNEFKFSGLLKKPSGVDDWFEVIDAMTKDYYLQLGNSMPTKAQAWVRLCEKPPTGYGITANKDNMSLTMIGIVKPFSKRSFDRRWSTYTAKSNHIETN